MIESACAICGAASALGPDERLPLLEVALCWECRDTVARFVGWHHLARGRNAETGMLVWFKHPREGPIAEVPYGAAREVVSCV